MSLESNVSNHMKYGFDYGTKPRVMILGDFTFPQFISNKLLGVGYGFYPQYKEWLRIPMLALIFETEDEGKKAFEPLISWIDGSKGNTNAVEISIIEYIDDSKYGFGIAQNTDLLMARSIPPELKDEISLNFSIASYLKILDKTSNQYKEFMNWVANSPYILLPGTRTGLVSSHIILKEKLNVIHQKDLSDTSEETILASLIASEQPPPKTLIPEQSEKAFPTMPIEEITKRREIQLKRFFPITYEKILAWVGFESLKVEINKQGYEDWQIIQAICNIFLIRNQSELFSDAETSIVDILQYLIANSQDIVNDNPRIEEVTKAQILGQIKLDSQVLLSYWYQKEELQLISIDFQQELKKIGAVQ
jgi:hypothetical protein